MYFTCSDASFGQTKTVCDIPCTEVWEKIRFLDWVIILKECATQRNVSLKGRTALNLWNINVFHKLQHWLLITARECNIHLKAFSQTASRKTQLLRGVGLGAGLAKEAPDWQRGREPKASAVSLPPQLLPSSPYMYISHFQSHPTFTVNIILSTSYCQPHLTVGAFNPTCSLQSGLLLPPTAQLNRLQTSLTRQDETIYHLFVKYASFNVSCNAQLFQSLWKTVGPFVRETFQIEVWVRYDLLQCQPRQCQISPQLSHLTNRRELVNWSTRKFFATVIQTSALCCEKISTIRRCT